MLIIYAIKSIIPYISVSLTQLVPEDQRQLNLFLMNTNVNEMKN